MKLLMINESRLLRRGRDYFAQESWYLLPQQLSQYCSHTTVWSPVDDTASKEDNAFFFPLNLEKMHIEPHDLYSTFSGYYRLWWKRGWAWQRKAKELITFHDVIFLRHPSPMLPLIAKLCHAQGKPLVILIDGDMLAQSDRILNHRGFMRQFYEILLGHWVKKEIKYCRQASLLYATSKHLMSRHRESGIPIKFWYPPYLNLKDIVVRKDTCEKEEIQLLRVCWLIPSKGLEYLLEAVAQVLKKGFNIKLKIVGKERSKNYKEQLKKNVEKLGLEGKVEFLGWVSHNCLKDIYLTTDIQILSSLAEGNPRVIPEGAAYGVPLITTYVGGILDCLTHEKDALIIPPKNSEAIAQSIERLITDQETRQRIIHHGYEIAKKACFETAGMSLWKDLRGLSQGNPL